MSDHFTILIPEDPEHVPDRSKQAQAESFFRQIAPNADHIESQVFSTIRFIDCAQNFESVSCPHCGEILDIAWWGQAMDADYGGDRGFRLAPITLPCCQQQATLHELQYCFAQGFGRYCLEGMNCGIGLLDSATIARLVSILGCELRVIYRHL
jgi:hypothetical protein